MTIEKLIEEAQEKITDIVIDPQKDRWAVIKELEKHYKEELTQAFHAGEAKGRNDLLDSVTKYQEQYVVTGEMIRQGIETLEILDKRMKQNAYRAIGEAIGEDNKGSFGSPLTPDGYAKRFTVYVLDPKAARQGDTESALKD